jgi:hypothetical protein
VIQSVHEVVPRQPQVIHFLDNGAVVFGGASLVAAEHGWKDHAARDSTVALFIAGFLLFAVQALAAESLLPLHRELTDIQKTLVRIEETIKNNKARLGEAEHDRDGRRKQRSVVNGPAKVEP